MMLSQLRRRIYLVVAMAVGLTVSLWGCGGGGKSAKSSSSSPYQLVSTGSGKGILSVRVNITRAVPEVSRVGVVVLGEGLTQRPLTGNISVSQGELSTSFKDVPIGLKWVLVGANGPDDRLLGISGKAVTVQDGLQTTVTLNLSLSQRVVDIGEKVSNATTISEFGTPPPIEIRRTNGTSGFYSNNFAPPKIQPVTTLWHGYKAPAGTFYFDPPVTYIGEEADPTQPLNAGKFQPGQVLTTNTTLKKVGDPSFSESQTATVEFISWQAAFQVGSQGSLLPVPEAAYRRVLISGGSRPLQWVEWLAKGFGPVVRLDLDPAATIGDGTVPTRIWVSHVPFGGPSFDALFYPLNITHERLYTVSPGTGAGDINVTVDVPFGLVACDADPDAGTVEVRYSLPVDTTPGGANSAINLANYNLFVNGSPLSLTSAAAKALSPQSIEIEGLTGLTPGATLKVVARNIKTADGLKTIEDPNGTTRDDPTDPNVCETKIRVVPFRIIFCSATDDPVQAVTINFNRPVDPVTALNKANYALQSPPGTTINLTPASVVIEIDRNDPSVVRIEGVSLNAGDLFVLTVTGVKDFKGNIIPNDGVSNRFKGTVQRVAAKQLVIASCTAGDSGFVEITFRFLGVSPWEDRPYLDPTTARNKANYTLESPMGNTIDLTPASISVQMVDDNRVRIEGLTLTKGNLFRVTVRNLRTVEGYRLLEDNVHNVFKDVVQDTTPPRATRVRFFTTAPHVEIEFNELLDFNSAQTTWYYSVRASDFSEFPSVNSATYDGRTVSLTLDSDLTAGKEYEVTIRAYGVRDLEGNTPRTDQALTGTAGTRRPRSVRSH